MRVNKKTILEMLDEKRYISTKLSNDIDNFLFNLSSKTNEFDNLKVVRFLKYATDDDLIFLNNVVNALLQKESYEDVLSSDEFLKLNILLNKY